MYTNEDLFFYNLLIKLGFKKEFDEWLNKLINNSERLDGILLELAWNQNDSNKLISYLDDYFLDNTINDEFVCEKLKRFILNKINNNELSCYQASKYLYDFADVVEKYDDCWDELRYPYYQSDYIDKDYYKTEEFDAYVMSFLENKININENPNNYIKTHDYSKITKLEERNKKIRMLYNIPDGIYTNYEYYHLFNKKLISKFRLIFFIICELLCLLLTIGSPLYFDKVPIEYSVMIMLFGLMLGIYGFAILCGYPVKGIKYSVISVLCYAFPLALSYYVLSIKTMWINGLISVVVGSILFFVFLLFGVIKPQNNYKNKLISYWNHLSQKYGTFNFYRDYHYMNLWDKSGAHITIAMVNDEDCSITIFNDILYEDVKLNDQIVYYEEYKGNYNDCVIKAIEVFKQYLKNKNI